MEILKLWYPPSRNPGYAPAKALADSMVGVKFSSRNLQAGLVREVGKGKGRIAIGRFVSVEGE